MWSFLPRLSPAERPVEAPSLGRPWESVCLLPVNTLIIGTPEFRHRALAVVLSNTPREVHYRSVVSTSPVELPQIDAGTLVVDGTDRCSTDAQDSLLRWMEEPGRRVRIVALTERPLHELVEQRRFRADLFYRLCVVQAPS